MPMIHKRLLPDGGQEPPSSAGKNDASFPQFFGSFFRFATFVPLVAKPRLEVTWTVSGLPLNLQGVYPYHYTAEGANKHFNLLFGLQCSRQILQSTVHNHYYLFLIGS